MGERAARAVLVVLVLLLACRRGAPGVGDGAVATAEGGAGVAPVAGFVVRREAPDLVFFWFGADGGTHLAGRVDEVPVAHRRVVRVDPPRPEQRPAGWIFLTDLSHPSAEGTFPVRAVRTDEVAREVAPWTGLRDLGSPTPPSAPTPGAPAGGQNPGGARQARAEVVIYGAAWCSACHQAAAYLRQRNVAFVEKDIEQDPAAQEEMADKARRAGVPLGSIPILDVRGHILRGFSPPDIDRALAGG